MNSLENRAGFNISSSKLQVVEINYKSGQFQLENVDEAYFNETLNFEHDKETKIMSVLQGAFDELLIRKSLNSNLTSFTLPLELFHIMQIPFDNTLLNQDLLEEFRWEYSIVYPFLSTNDLAIQYIEIDKNNLTEAGTALVIAIQRKYLQIIHNFCEHNRLKVRFIDNVHIAGDRALFVNNLQIDKGLVLSVYFNDNILSVIFSYDSKPVYFKTIPLNDAGEIVSLLQNEINANNYIRINRNFIENAFITGENISSSFVKSLSVALGINFRQYNPFEKIKPDASLYQNKFYSTRFNSFASAAGIALRLA